MTRFIAACVQVNSRDVMSDNLARAATYARDAHAAGARLIAFPENVSMMSFGGSNVRAAAFPEDEHPGLVFFCDLAEELKSTLIVGSLHVNVPGEDRVANRCFVIGPDGKVITSYDKIHMFDVEVGDGQSYRESRAYRPGERAVLAETEFGKLGMTICYDVRFPHLYRKLAQAGAGILTIPAAFTRVTGKAHWHVLVRARAIETGSFVIAPAQGGKHEDGRETFGHSLIVSPWGEVLAEKADDEPGVILADLDLDAVAKARRRIPSLGNDQDIRFKD